MSRIAIPEDLQEAAFRKRAHLVLQWIQQSIDATGGRGSAAYCHLWRGWSPAYPETTGYLIETLFDYGHYLGDDRWSHLAIACADWLCEIQLPAGAFPGGLGEQSQPLVFDTGQVLFGMSRAWKETGNEKYRRAGEKALDWLMAQLDDDGAWRRNTYAGFAPAYHTRVLWAAIDGARIFGKPIDLSSSIRYYRQFLNPSNGPEGWGFNAGEPSFLHTVAYTLRGAWEVSSLMDDRELQQQCLTTMDHILSNNPPRHGKLPGRFLPGWQGDRSFVCVVGQAQWALLGARIFQATRQEKHLQAALESFLAIARCPKKWPISGWLGGIPGSFPTWGAYQPFRFINWGAKFYLDAYLLLKEHLHGLNP